MQIGDATAQYRTSKRGLDTSQSTRCQSLQYNVRVQTCKKSIQVPYCTVLEIRNLFSFSSKGSIRHRSKSDFSSTQVNTSGGISIRHEKSLESVPPQCHHSVLYVLAKVGGANAFKFSRLLEQPNTHCARKSGGIHITMIESARVRFLFIITG